MPRRMEKHRLEGQDSPGRALHLHAGEMLDSNTGCGGGLWANVRCPDPSADCAFCPCPAIPQ